MLIVIQCASRKNPTAGHLCSRNGQKMRFVADPVSAPTSLEYAYARPDDISDTGNSWRDALLRYNENPSSNPLGLLPAWELYENSTYKLLKDIYGEEKLYILSAGWGLIAANFLTPDYDITFSPQAELYKRRDKKDNYNDLCMIPADTMEPIVFFGGKDYVGQFCSLTRYIKSHRYVFYNSVNKPIAPNCTLKKYNTFTRTNWHYECARAFVAGKIGI